MTVYVDDARVWTLGSVRRSHMAADSLEELHVFAGLLGIGRHNYHSHAEHPHYDVNETQRKLALAAGAQAVRPRELLVIAKRATNGS